MDLETFADDRDEELVALAAVFLPAVAEALAADSNLERESILLAALDAMFIDWFTDEFGSPPEMTWVNQFLADMEAAVAQTVPAEEGEPREQQEKRIANWFATATINAATLASTFRPGTEATKTWVTMRDDRVREVHGPLHGFTIGTNEVFTVGTTPPASLMYPGQPVGPPEAWINCRCVLSVGSLTAGGPTSQDVLARSQHDPPPAITQPFRNYSQAERDEMMKKGQAMPPDGSYPIADEDDLRNAIQAIGRASDPDKVKRHIRKRARALGKEELIPDTWAKYHAAQEATMTTIELNREHQAGDERAPVTAVPNEAMREVAAGAGDTGKIATGTELSEDEVAALAQWFLDNKEGTEAPGFRAGEDGYPNDARIAWDQHGGDEGQSWASWYLGQVNRGGSHVDEESTRDPRVENDKGGEPQGDAFPAEDDEAMVAAADEEPPVPDEPIPAEDGNQPFHGVLAVEGEDTGDGRRFAPGSITWADLPIAIRYVRSDVGEHQGAVTVGKITDIERVGNEILFEGELFTTVPETDEVIMLVAEGLGGVSIDADSAEADVDPLEAMFNDEVTEYTAGRIRAATIVAIPAFVQANLQLGPREDVDNPIPDNEDALAAAVADSTATFKRGSGWLTHPDETRRLHTYWTKGEGAAKIRWGTGGDFTRCTRALRKYINPLFLNRTCAEWHHDALGYWPGEKGRPGNPPKTSGVSTQFSLVASVAGRAVPVSLFDDPALDKPTPLVFEPRSDGRYEVFGHAAAWGTCHIGIDGVCVEPPPSPSNYAYFHTGSVETDEGVKPCGVITMGTGHAGRRLRAGATVAHYDDTGTQAMKVRAGEDGYGIWIHGITMDGLTDEDVERLMGSAPSGDWREIGGHLELVAALAVNTPGFPIPRTGFGIENGRQVALVAAGVVMPDVPVSVGELADKVQAELDRRGRLNEVRASSRGLRLRNLKGI